MRHLITGGAGFVGNRLAGRLSSRGERVRVLDTWSAPSNGMEFIQGSVLDRDCVAAAMRGVDVLHHNAAVVAQVGNGAPYWDVNVEGTRIVAEEAVRAGVKTVFHVSTTAVFGLTPAGPITTDTPLRPVEPYGRSKLAGEHIMSDVCRQHGIRHVTIRPRVVLGGGRLGIFHILFEWIRENRNVYVIGDGANRQQFVHIDDLLDFYLMVLDGGAEGAFNVGADQFGTLASDLAGLIQHAESRSKIRCLPPQLVTNVLRVLYFLRLSPLVPWHYLTYHRDCYFDTGPLLAMGWRPRYSNIDMLRESYDWYCCGSQGVSADSSPHRSPLRQGILGMLKKVS